MGLKKVLKGFAKAAPIALNVATAAGVVPPGVTRALGLGRDATPEDVEAELAKNDPAKLLALKQAEAELEAKLAETDLKHAELEFERDKFESAQETKGADQQFELNKKQLDSRSWWVAGARPAAMWICNAVIAFYYIPPSLAYGIGSFIDVLKGRPMDTPPFEINHLLVMLGQMLGLGVLRSLDKKFGSTHK